MARVVLVDGISWGEPTPKVRSEWIAALADGVRRRGFGDVARGLIAADDVAFVADPGLVAGPARAMAADEIEFAEQLAGDWLAAAAERAPTRHDQTLALLARRQLASAARASPVATVKLAGLAWFGGPDGVSSALLQQFAAYLYTPELRSASQQRVLDFIDDDTRLIVAHSLGCLIAFDALHQLSDMPPIGFVTVGSPIGSPGLDGHLSARTVPDCVTAWGNVVDVDDLVASACDLSQLLTPSVTRSVLPETEFGKFGRCRPDQPGGYLTSRPVADAVAAALRG